jgi:hypothetical protein
LNENGTGDVIANGTLVSSWTASTTLHGDLLWANPDPVPIKDAIKMMVEEALRDPAVLAAALIKLPQPIRDQVRIMLDALEQGSSH